MGIRDSIAEQGRRLAEGLKGGIVKPQETIPLEEMDLSLLAEVILNPPLNSDSDESPMADFTIKDLLNQLGYWAASDSDDYKVVFPEQYSKTRGLVDELVKKAALDRRDYGEPINQERFRYDIKDKAKLEAIFNRETSV